MKGAPYNSRRFAAAFIVSIASVLLSSSGSADVSFVIPDPTFPAGSGPDYYVRTLALDANGRVLVGGQFTNVNQVRQPYLARLNPDGTVDSSFAPQVDTDPRRIDFLPNGSILISGTFTNVGGVPRPGLARLQSNGSLDSGFAPPQFSGPPQSPLTAIPAPAGGVFVSGSFTNVGGNPINNLARLLEDGSVDTSFLTVVGRTNSASLLAVQADSRPLVFGSIPNASGPALTNLFRFNTDGSLDSSFQCGLASMRVLRVALQPDGKLLVVVAPDFGSYLPGPPQLVRLGTNGAVDASFSATFDFPGFPFNGALNGLVVQGDGKVLVAGTFLRVDGLARGKIARLEPDGGLDYCFDVPLASELNLFSLAADVDGRVILGGFFSGLQGQPHANLMRLLPPTSCAPANVELAVSRLPARQDVLQVRIPVVRHGGEDLTQTVGFATRDGSAVGGVDYQTVSGSVQFQPGERSQFISVPLLTSSFVGQKTFDVGLTQAGPAVTLGELTNTTVTLTSSPPGTAGAADTNYLVQLDGEVRFILPLADGSAVIGGSFTNVNGQPSPNLARLLPNAGTDPGFIQGLPLDGTIYSLALDNTGRILVAGDFRNVRGVWRPGLARLGLDGSLDPTFAPFDLWPTNAYGATQIIAVAGMPDGSVICGGIVPTGTYDSTNIFLKLLASGAVDPAFTNSPVEVGTGGLTALPNNETLLVGAGLGGSLARLGPDGMLDLGFLPPADLQFAYYDGTVRPLPDGRVTVFGFSSFWGLATQPPLWRLNPDGSRDQGFALAASNGMFGRLTGADQMTTATDGRVLVYGYFDDGTNGQQTLARLTENGSYDFSFDPGTGPKPRMNSSVYIEALAPLPQGGWLMGGEFGSYDTFNQSYMVKILPESLVRPLTFQFSITNLSVWETNGLLTLTVWRRGDASGSARVTVRTVDGTALSNVNYTPINVQLDFAPGEWSKTVSINILQDYAVTGTQQFTIQLQDPTGGFNLGSASAVTVQVQNNDAAVAFTSGNFHAVEQDGFALAGITWTGALSAGLQASVNVLPVTGSTTDLWATSATLTVGGRTTNWFRIPLVTDPQRHSARTFLLELVPNGTLLVGALSNATLVIDDLDFATTPARGVAGVVEATANSPEGGIYLAGDFTGVHGVSRVRVARLQPDGEVDLAFDPGTGPNSNVTAIAVQPDGKLLIAGAFTAVSGLARAGVARLITDGSVDPTFDPGSGARHTNGTAFVTSLLPEPDGNLFIAGCFTHFADRYTRLVARLLPNGSVDSTFSSPFLPYYLGWPRTPGPDQSVLYAVAQQTDGKLLAGGQNLYVYQAGFAFSASLVRLGTNGQADPTFSTTQLRALPAVQAMALAPDGKILIDAGPSNRSWLGIYRLTANGAGDTTFQVTNVPNLGPFYSSQVKQLQIQPDGTILFCAAVSDSSYLRSLPDRVLIGRLLPGGAWDNGFNLVQCDLPLLQQIGPFWFNITAQPGTFIASALQLVPTVQFRQQPDGILLLGGALDLVDGEPRRRLARLDPDGALRGRLLLNFSTSPSPHVSAAPEVDTPYVIETSAGWGSWTDLLTNSYPWVPVDSPFKPDSSTRFFRARSQPQP